VVALWRRQLTPTCTTLWKTDWWTCWGIVRILDPKFWHHTATRSVWRAFGLASLRNISSLSAFCLTFHGCCRCGDKARWRGICAARQSYWWSVQKVNGFMYQEGLWSYTANAKVIRKSGGGQTVSDLCCRIALCIDGQRRFTTNLRQLLGKEAIKQRQLRLLGYEVVQVSLWVSFFSLPRFDQCSRHRAILKRSITRLSVLLICPVFFWRN